MKALTIRQPWASLIAAGVKTIETRSWSTKHRGPLAIHAGKVVPGWVLPLKIGGFEVDKDNPRGTAPSYLLRGPINWPYRLPLGCLVATADLVDCVPIISEMALADAPYMREDGTLRLLSVDDGGDALDRRLDLPFGDFTPGRFAWLLDNVQRIQPVPARGKQGLWEWSA